jgi:hypothetical protein
MNTPLINSTYKTPEQYMQESLGLVQTASLENQYLHLSQEYMDSPGRAAVVLCYVTCSDVMAAEVRDAIDMAVQRVFAEHGLTIRRAQ